MFKEKQRKEAISRMRLLDLHENAIKEFENEGILNKSESIGLLYHLNDIEDNIIREWEEKSGNVAYHVRLDNANIGPFVTVFYVSKYEEEWEIDREDIGNNTAIAYVMNLNDDYMSEFGSVVFRRNAGGIVRMF